MFLQNQIILKIKKNPAYYIEEDIISTSYFRGSGNDCWVNWFNETHQDQWTHPRKDCSAAGNQQDKWPAARTQMNPLCSHSAGWACNCGHQSRTHPHLQKKTTVTVCETEGGKITGGARIWCGGELADGRVPCIILPPCSGSPSVTEIELSELATDGQQQNFKWKVSLMRKNLRQNRKLQVFAFAYMKTI